MHTTSYYRLGLVYTFPDQMTCQIITRPLLSEGDKIDNMIVFLSRANFFSLLLEIVRPMAVLAGTVLFQCSKCRTDQTFR